VVWRRFRVSGGISLNALHDRILLPLMGWRRRYHGYHFWDVHDGSDIGPVGEAYVDDMHCVLQGKHFADDRLYLLADFMSEPGDRFQYVYDLGDQFVHHITLEALVPDENTYEALGGALAGPPEDSRGWKDDGNRGYSELLREVKEKGADAMTASLLKAAQACIIRCCQRDNQGRFSPFPFEPMEHTLAVHTTLAEPFGVASSSAPRATGYTMGPDGSLSAAGATGVMGATTVREVLWSRGLHF